MCLCDSLSMASELKVSAVSRDKQSTVTSPPWIRYQLCLSGVVPSNLSWKPVLELSFIPIKTSSKAHWGECFPRWRKNKHEKKAVISKRYCYTVALLLDVLFYIIVDPYHALTLLWLPPTKYCVGRFGCRWQLNGYYLGLQEGTKVQLPQELPLDTIVGRELDNDTYNHRKKEQNG